MCTNLKKNPHPLIQQVHFQELTLWKYRKYTQKRYLYTRIFMFYICTYIYINTRIFTYKNIHNLDINESNLNVQRHRDYYISNKYTYTMQSMLLLNMMT